MGDVGVESGYDDADSDVGAVEEFWWGFAWVFDLHGFTGWIGFGVCC